MRNLVKYLQYLTFAGIFATPFIVLVIDGSQVFPFITGKNFLFRLLVEVIFFAWLALAFLKEEYRPKKSMLLIAISIFLGVMFVANVFGLNPGKSFWSNFERMEGWVTLVHLLGYFIVLGSVLNTRELWDRFWNTSIVVSIIVGLYGMGELIKDYAIDKLGVSPTEGIWQLLPDIDQGGVRIDATFGNATYLAVYMLFHIFLTTFFLLRFQTLDTKRRVFYIATLVLQMYALYMTATRGAILGLILGFSVVAIGLLLREKAKTAPSRISVGFLVVLFVCVGIFFAIKDTEFVQDKGALTRIANISLEDKTTLSRFLMWDLSWEGVKERPILGYGQGNFNYVFNKHYNPRLYNQEQWFDRTHNIVFDWLIAGGIVGFIAYVLMFVALIRMLLRNTQLSSREKVVFLGLISAYVFQNLFVFDQIGSYMLFFAVLAYIHSLGAEKPLFGRIFNISSDAKTRIAIPFILIGLLVVPYMVNASGYFQSRTTIKALNQGQAQTVEELNNNIENILTNLAKAMQYGAMGTAEVRERTPNVAIDIISAEQVDEELKQQAYVLARDSLEAQIQDTPEDARYRIIYGNFLTRLGFLEEGITQFQKAIELTPNKQVVYAELAQVYARQGNNDLALQTIRDAYHIFEDNDDAWVRYVFFAQLAQDTELANALVQEALTAGQYSRVIDLLEMQKRNNPETFPADAQQLLDELQRQV